VKVSRLLVWANGLPAMRHYVFGSTRLLIVVRNQQRSEIQCGQSHRRLLPYFRYPALEDKIVQRATPDLLAAGKTGEDREK
jgi:hypothetical protein